MLLVAAASTLTTPGQKKCEKSGPWMRMPETMTWIEFSLPAAHTVHRQQ